MLPTLIFFAIILLFLRFYLHSTSSMNEGALKILNILIFACAFGIAINLVLDNVNLPSIF